MAKLVGAFAASHTPVMLNFPQAIPDEDRELIFASFRKLGQAIEMTDPQIVITISDDHLHNFFLDNLPAFCIGAANSYLTPAEHWLKAERQTIGGDSQFGAFLLSHALTAGFDPAFSMQLLLDHGVLTPLLLAGIASSITIVPVLINCVQPPFPTMRRCFEWGGMLRQAIETYTGAERIAILATGGMSHNVATPRMGILNEEFDRQFLHLLNAGDDNSLIQFTADHVNEAGNGAEEMRTWLMAHGAAQSHSFETIYYKPVANWYTGIGMGQWCV